MVYDQNPFTAPAAKDRCGGYFWLNSRPLSTTLTENRSHFRFTLTPNITPDVAASKMMLLR